MGDGTPAGFTAESWRDFIGKGRQLVQRENDQTWTWGDLAHEYVPSSNTTANTGRVLEQWTEEIGYEGEVGTLRVRRGVSAAWPLEIRISSGTV